MSFAERLKQARTMRRKSQRGLAADAGLSGGVVGHIESGRTADVELNNAIRLAEALEVSPSWLLLGLGDPIPKERTVESEARYPNLDEAIRLVGSKWRDATVDSLRGFKARSPTDLRVGTWINLGDEIERSYRDGRELGEPLPDEDDVPPAGRT